MLTPLPLVCRDPGTSTCLLLLCGFLWTMPTWHLILGLIFPFLGAHWVLPHGDGELCLYSAHFSAPLSGPALLSWHPLPFACPLHKGRAAWNPFCSEGELGLPGLLLLPGPSTDMARLGGSALTSQMGWAAVCDVQGCIFESVNLTNFITWARQAEGSLVHRVCSRPHQTGNLPKLLSSSATNSSKLGRGEFRSHPQIKSLVCMVYSSVDTFHLSPVLSFCERTSNGKAVAEVSQPIDRTNRRRGKIGTRKNAFTV